jgi:hypothetical protein
MSLSRLSVQPLPHIKQLRPGKSAQLADLVCNACVHLRLLNTSTFALAGGEQSSKIDQG